MIPKSKTALFAGSFNPFTIGHQSIVERSLKICDKVIIGFGYNIDKPVEPVDKNMAIVMELYAGNDRVSVAKYTGLTVDFARECKADFLVRGVRGATDFEYERNLAEVNLRISGIETILLPALPEMAFISSSMVRELASYGHNINEFIPAKN